MNPALTYTRVSSREQQQEGFSLGAQSRLLTEYADRQPFKGVMSFEDVGTAKTSGRQQFGEMIKWLKTNRWCRTVLVEKTDRLYRNFKDYVLLEELDVEIHLVKEGQIISKDSRSQAQVRMPLGLGESEPGFGKEPTPGVRCFSYAGHGMESQLLHPLHADINAREGDK